jgi:hypothetical protein
MGSNPGGRLDGSDETLGRNAGASATFSFSMDFTAEGAELTVKALRDAAHGWRRGMDHDAPGLYETMPHQEFYAWREGIQRKIRKLRDIADYVETQRHLRLD